VAKHPEEDLDDYVTFFIENQILGILELNV